MLRYRSPAFVVARGLCHKGPLLSDEPQLHDYKGHNQAVPHPYSRTRPSSESWARQKPTRSVSR